MDIDVISINIDMFNRYIVPTVNMTTLSSTSQAVVINAHAPHSSVTGYIWLVTQQTTYSQSLCTMCARQYSPPIRGGDSHDSPPMRDEKAMILHCDDSRPMRDENGDDFPPMRDENSHDSSPIRDENSDDSRPMRDENRADSRSMREENSDDSRPMRDEKSDDVDGRPSE